MTLPDSIIESVGPVVESAAAEVSRFYYKFGGSQEDLAGEGWVWCFDHPGKLAYWFDPDKHSPREGEKLLATTLRRHLRNHGEDLKAQSLGYNRDDLMYYSKNMVRELLPKVFDIEAWIYPEQGEEGRRGQGDPAAGGNWVATLADVARAYSQLGQADKDLLARFHRDGVSNNDLADECGVTKQKMSEWHDKAVRRLVNQLGGTRPHPQHDEDCHAEDGHWGAGRVAVSNAAARAYQQNAYEDE